MCVLEGGGRRTERKRRRGEDVIMRIPLSHKNISLCFLLLLLPPPEAGLDLNWGAGKCSLPSRSRRRRISISLRHKERRPWRLKRTLLSLKTSKGLQPIPADTGRVSGKALDRSAANHRAGTQRQSRTWAVCSPKPQIFEEHGKRCRRA